MDDVEVVVVNESITYYWKKIPYNKLPAHVKDTINFWYNTKIDHPNLQYTCMDLLSRTFGGSMYDYSCCTYREIDQALTMQFTRDGYAPSPQSLTARTYDVTILGLGLGLQLMEFRMTYEK